MSMRAVVDDRLGEDVLVLVELSGGWRVEHARGVLYAQGPSLMLLAEFGRVLPGWCEVHRC